MNTPKKGHLRTTVHCLACNTIVRSEVGPDARWKQALKWCFTRGLLAGEYGDPRHLCGERRVRIVIDSALEWEQRRMQRLSYPGPNSV